MALFRIFKGNSANLPEEKHDGYCYFTTDDGIFYIDYLDADGTTLRRRPISGPGNSIEYIVGTQTAKTGSWTGITKDPSLAVGKTIAYKLPYAGNGNASLTLTFTNPTGAATTGAIAVYTNTSRVTTHYGANSVILLTYDGTYWRASEYWNSNSRDPGYGKITPGAASTSAEAITANTTQIAAGTYNENLHINPGNKWVQVGATSGASNGGDTLTLGHALSDVTAGTSSPNTAQTPSFNSTFNIPTVTVDEAGHVTAMGTTTVKIPAQTNLSGGSAAANDKTVVGGVTVSEHAVTVAKKTMTEGAGISITGTTDKITIAHSNSVTAGTAKGDDSKTLAFDGTFTIPTVTYDDQGHVTGKGTTTMTMPANPNTDITVKQTAKTDNVDYKILTTVSASPTSGSAAEAGYGTNLAYNPSTNTLKTGNASLTGALTVTGQAILNDNLMAQGITATDLLVNGNSRFNQIPISITPEAASNDTSVATTAFVKNAIGGLSGAMHFRGTTTSTITDGSTTNPITISGSSYTAAAGDVVLREVTAGNIFEYVWTGSAWEMLGRDTSFKVTQNAVSSPAANGNTTAFIDTISQDTNGNITVTKKNLDTSGTWRGNAVTATTASKLSNISNVGDTNKPVYFTANGVPAAINYTIDKSVPSTAVFTDRYVNSATFTDDTTNTSASPVKMTLTRAGSDTATVTANIPKVSSSSAGVVPKGTAVSTQSQTTKFLREDGIWAAPSYTATAEDEIYPVNVTLTSLTQGASNKTHTEILAAVNTGKLPIVNTAYETTKMVASLTFVNSDKAVFTYENQMDNEMTYAVMEIINNTVTISWKNQYIVVTDLGNAAFDDIVPIEHGGTGNSDGYIRAGQKSGTTIGTKATAEGNNTTASGNYSHAEGSLTIASGNYSHAEGYHTTASANTGHAEGYGTIASAAGAHAEGISTNALAARSHAEGFSTIAKGTASHVFGEYNEEDVNNITRHSDEGYGNYIEIVGNGTADDARSNARTLDWNGNEILAGKLTVGTDPTNNMDVATKQYVDNYKPIAANLTTTQNAIAKYSDTTGTFANSGVTIDNSNNIATSGDITVKGTYIFGTNTSNKTNRYISSDTANNIFAKINNIYALVVTDAEVRRGSSASAMNLGTSSYPWKNIYGTNIYGNGSNLTSLNASNISSGTVAFARLPSIYWANTVVASAASYNTTPEVASVKIGNGTATAAGEKGATLQYDATLEVLNFVFA